ASVTQNIAENYGATNILPTQRCVDLNLDGPSNFCIANINPEGLSLKPGHEFTVTTPVSFPVASWWGEDSPTDVKIYGADEKRYDCTRIEGNQWSCILPDVGFHSGGLRVHLGVDNWRAGWGGMLTVDDLVPDSPEFSNATAEFEQANDKSEVREGKQWLATKTPVQVELEFDLVSGSADSLAAHPIHVLVEKSMDTDKPTSEWVVLDNQKVDVVDGHYRVTGEIYPQQGWSSEAFFTLTLGYKLTDNDTPIPFIDPDNKTRMTGQGAYLDASPMRIVDSVNTDGQCILTQSLPQTCDYLANGREVTLTDVNVWQDADQAQTIKVDGKPAQTLQGGHITQDLSLDMETTGQKSVSWNNVSTRITYNTDPEHIVVEDTNPVNNVSYKNAFIYGAVTKVSNTGSHKDGREVNDTGIHVSLTTLNGHAISGLEGQVTWSAEYPLLEFVKIQYPELPSLVEQGLLLVQNAINNYILANSATFSASGDFYLDVATLNDGISQAIADLGSQYDQYFPRFANLVLPLDLVAHYRVNGVDKVKSKRFNIAIGDRGKRIINFNSGDYTPQCLTNIGGKFVFQECDTSHAVNDETDPNVLFKFIPAAMGTLSHPTNVFQVRPFSDDSQCLTVAEDGYTVSAQQCDANYGVAQLFTFQAQGDYHFEESIITSANTPKMTIASLKNGRIFDRSGGGGVGQANDLIVYPKNYEQGSVNQHMYVSRFRLQTEPDKPVTVPVDLTMHCETWSQSYFSQSNKISLSASNQSKHDAYVYINYSGRWALIRAGESKQIDTRTMTGFNGLEQVYRFRPEYNPHNSFFSLPANPSACQAWRGKDKNFSEYKKGYNAFTEIPE
ncbi:hypothetical protein, partial [Vibrio azureus]